MHVSPLIPLAIAIFVYSATLQNDVSLLGRVFRLFAERPKAITGTRARRFGQRLKRYATQLIELLVLMLSDDPDRQDVVFFALFGFEWSVVEEAFLLLQRFLELVTM